MDEKDAGPGEQTHLPIFFLRSPKIFPAISQDHRDQPEEEKDGGNPCLGPKLKDNVVGVFMPSRYSSQESLRDAKETASNLGIKFMNISIEPVFKLYMPYDLLIKYATDFWCIRRG